MKRTRLSLNKNLIAPLMALLLVGGTIGTVAAQEQNPQPPAPSDENQLDAPVDDAGFDISLDAQGPGGRGGMGGIGFTAVCSTTSSTDVVAKALGMTAAELRLALVSGKSISDIAASKNIEMTKIQEALTAQHKADLEQAVKDGLITQAQLDAMNQMQANAPKPNNPAAGNNIRFQIRVPANNTVNRLDVAAKALGMTCVDLVKAEQAGKTIAEVAQGKNVAVQTVIDAVVNAVKAAAAQDVKEGLITQAQADAKLSRIANDVGQWVYSTPRGNRGPGGRNGGFGGNGGPNGNNGGNNGNNGQPRRPGQGGGTQPTAVPPAATPAK